MTLTSAAPASGPSVAATSVSQHRRLRRIAADYAILRGCLLLVACYAGFGLLGFAVFAGFWPPPDPISAPMPSAATSSTTRTVCGSAWC